MCPKADRAKRVLDAGSGSGLWAIEFADAYPETEVGILKYLGPGKLP